MPGMVESSLMAFTEQQQGAIRDMNPRVCVSAGAGSGKTTILIERIVYLLSHPECWPDGNPGLDRIVAITFTDKAAAEMKARLRRRFREAQAAEERSGGPDWRELERQVDGARVSTIHSFCGSILRENALRIGMDPDWGVLADADAERLMEEAVNGTVRELLEDDLSPVTQLSMELTLAQIKSGLAEMLQRRWEFQPGDESSRYADEEGLYHYWKKSFPDVQEAFLHVFRNSPKTRFWLESLRALEGRCTDPTDKREVQRASCQQVLAAIAAGEPKLAEQVQNYLATFTRMAGSKNKWPEGDFERVKSALDGAKKFFLNDCLLPEWDDDLERLAAEMTCNFYQAGMRVMEAYRDARQAWNSLDYEDMINETLDLLQRDTAMRARVASGISFLLIDEFQDTDGRQFDIARMLADVENGPRLFLVGDVKQSIYYFRGAEVSLFKDVIRNTGETRMLLDNFRSLPGVLHFINDFFSQSRLLEAVEAYKPMGVFRQDSGSPCVEYYLPSISGKQSAAEKREAEAQFVAKRILEVCSGTPVQVTDMEKRETRPATFDDVVLLFRRGSYMDTYESALREFNIPYNRVAGSGFFQRREVQDILALLKLVLDPWDEEALVTVLRSPLVGLSDESLMRMTLGGVELAAAFHSKSVPEQFGETDLLNEAWSLFEALRAERESEPGRFLRHALELTGYEAVLLGQHLGLQRVANLRKVIQLADTFGQSRPATLVEFTEYLDDVTFRELKEGESPLQSKGMGAVTLMTIHKAKGLEFPIVILPEMYVTENKGVKTTLFHHKSFGVASKVANEEESLKKGAFAEVISRYRRHEEAMESARILYVAMTRARDYLVLCGHPEADPFTWAGQLNRCYDLTKHSHGDLVQGSGWQMTVKREVPDVSPLKVVRPERPEVVPELVARQIAPVETEPGAARVFSVSRLLSRMSGTDDADFEPDEAVPAGEDAYGAEFPDRAFAMARGTLVHKLFETWDFARDVAPDISALVADAGLGLGQYETLKEVLAGMVQHFRKSRLWSDYTNAVSIEREVPFILDIGPALVRGVIDAVVGTDLIVDYKTGKPGSALEAHYETQLCLYAAALRRLKGALPERGILWYADYGHPHEIAFSEERIEGVLAEAAACCGQS